MPGLCRVRRVSTVTIVSHDNVTTALADSRWLPGCEHDAAGARVPGATISPQHHYYNLAEIGLAWHENVGVEVESKFGRFVEGIKQEIRGS